MSSKNYENRLLGGKRKKKTCYLLKNLQNITIKHPKKIKI